MEFVDDARIPADPYPELREILQAFVMAIAAELSGNLLGIYLVGSLASGDFDLDSDIDFLVVTKNELTEVTLQALQGIQREIHDLDHYPAKHLEGSYVTISDLNDGSTVGQKKLPYFDRMKPAASPSVFNGGDKAGFSNWLQSNFTALRMAHV
jgi:predicted nucleotidyltransferase